MRRVLVAVCAMALGGCATVVIPTEQAKEVSGAARFPAAGGGGTETVIVKRADVFRGGACAHQVLIDGRPVADLGRGDKVTFKLPPGRHILGARMQGALCDKLLRELAVELAGGQTRTFFVEWSPNMEFQLQETAY